jgi:hypothetical protein
MKRGKVYIIGCFTNNMGYAYKDKKGYPRFANGVAVHRAVAQNKVGRKLRRDEVVHHQNGDKSDFRKSNISVMSRSYHSKLHKAMKRGFW